MKEQFATPEIAYAFKELGFDEECFGVYCNDHLMPRYGSRNSKFRPVAKMDLRGNRYCTAPTWQQAIEWLLPKLNFIYPLISIQCYCDGSGRWYSPMDKYNDLLDLNFNEIEDAIMKAIEIIKEKEQLKERE